MDFSHQIMMYCDYMALHVNLAKNYPGQNAGYANYTVNIMTRNIDCCMQECNGIALQDMAVNSLYRLYW